MNSEMLKESIKELAEKLLLRDDMEKRSLKLRDVFVSKSASPVVRIFLDKEKGIGISDLEYFHREFEAVMDAEDLIKSKYTLEVSSPGEEKSR